MLKTRLTSSSSPSKIKLDHREMKSCKALRDFSLWRSKFLFKMRKAWIYSFYINIFKTTLILHSNVAITDEICSCSSFIKVVWHQIAKPLCIWNVFVMNVFSFEYILLLSTPTTTTSTLKVLQAASSLCLLCLSLAEKAIRSSHASFL